MNSNTQRKYKPATLTSNEQAFTGRIYLNPGDFNEINLSSSSPQPKSKNTILVKIKTFVLLAESSNDIPSGQFGASSFQREMFQLSKFDEVTITPAEIKEKNPLAEIKIAVDIARIIEKDYSQMTFDDKGAIDISEELIAQEIRKFYSGKFVNTHEKFVARFYQRKLLLSFTISGITSMNAKSREKYGFIESSENTDIICTPKNLKLLKISNERMDSKNIIDPNMNFQSLGIGGLDKEFNEIFRRAFNTRRFPQSVIEQYGIAHVKGMLLHGPPGTGKTLIARKIAGALNCKEPKICNGPEVFGKYVGESEQNIRELFQDAETEQGEKGDQSGLHVIIFDEIDAICRARGSTSGGTGVGDNVVNQLLSKMDGVESLNNILIIGMTNRKDMMDEAILRPGRMEIHLEIGLPDQFGRNQIFEIHTRKMKENGKLGNDVNIEELARLTKNYTGAEIESVCKSATSYALWSENNKLGTDPSSASMPSGEESIKQINSTTEAKKQATFKGRQVFFPDFKRALEEIPPAFGMDSGSLENRIRGGMYDYGSSFQNLYNECTGWIAKVKHSDTQRISLLLEGDRGTGKTALAAKLALESEFPFVKLITPEMFVGQGVQQKLNKIVKTFHDAYKSTLSMIILDDIETLLEFTSFGRQFSNMILKDLKVLVKADPPNADRKLMIIGTTSMKYILQEMDLVDNFNVCLTVPKIRDQSEIFSILKNFQGDHEEMQKIATDVAEQHVLDGLSMRNIILAADSDSGKIDYNNFINSINDLYGVQPTE